MFKPGEVVGFYSEVAGKRKFHLCVSLSGHFLFLNSPKAKAYPGDLVVSCDEIPCLEPTSSGNSIISCSMVLSFTEAELRRAKAERLGELSRALMLKILAKIEETDLLSDADKESVLRGLGDYL